MSRLKALILSAAMLVIPIAANAQVAHTGNTTQLRAGPDPDYPVVAILGAGVAVNVQGCLRDYSWCDVVVGEYRGWVHGQNIVTPYRGFNAPVIHYGAAIGMGVVTFVIGNYWNDHYIGRPWYRQMRHWRHRTPRAVMHPVAPQRFSHPQAARHPAPVFRPHHGPRSADRAPREARALLRPAHTRHATTHATPVHRPAMRPAGATFNSRSQAGTPHQGRAQRATPGATHGARRGP
ncbi:MAG: SH3 domain-containing protein [Burkholderiales bacterium]|nr:SH3 domain-containing protein [Burkholderiales bacterium]